MSGAIPSLPTCLHDVDRDNFQFTLHFSLSLVLLGLSFSCIYSFILPLMFSLLRGSLGNQISVGLSVCVPFTIFPKLLFRYLPRSSFWVTSHGCFSFTFMFIEDSCLLGCSVSKYLPVLLYIVCLVTTRAAHYILQHFLYFR